MSEKIVENLKKIVEFKEPSITEEEITKLANFCGNEHFKGPVTDKSIPEFYGKCIKK